MKLRNIILIIVALSLRISAQNIYNLDEYLEDTFETIEIPGMSVSVIQNNNIIYSKGFGVESTNTNIPMTDSTQLAIGSITKSFTSVAMMMLVEEGLISLDDKVTNYLPWFRTLNIDESNKITIDMILSNTSGLHHDSSSFSWAIEELDNDSAEVMARTLASEQLLFEPGTSFAYSNSGFILAGLIIEKITGIEYEDFIKNRILVPLAMHNSTTDIDDFDESNTNYGHFPYFDSYISAYGIKNVSAIAAGSEFRSTTLDMINYINFYLNKGTYMNQELLAEESIERMFTAKKQLKYFDRFLGYGYGLLIDNENGYVLHGGQTRTMSSLMIFSPEENIGVMLLFNVSEINSSIKGISSSQIGCNILNILTNKPLQYDLIEEPYNDEYMELSSEYKEKMFGEYISPDGLYSAEIIENTTGMHIILSSALGKASYILNFRSNLSAIGINNAEDIELRFIADSNGNIVSVRSNGIQLHKKRDIDFSGYNDILIEDINIKLHDSYQLEVKSDHYVFANLDNEILFYIDIPKNEASVLFNEFISNYSIYNEGIETFEWINSFKCFKKISIIESEGQLMQSISIYCNNNDRSFYCQTVVPYYEATEILKDVIYKIILSL